MKHLMATLCLALGLAACGSAPPTPTAPPPAATPTAVVIPTTTPLLIAEVMASPTPTLTPAPTPTAIPATAIQELPLPPNPRAYRLQLVAEGFSQPIFITHAGDGSGRVFVAEQGGAIYLLHNGLRQSEPFLDLTGLAVNNAFERGLLGLAFSPHYASDGQFFVNYTDPNGDTVVARYRVSGDANRADPASAQVVLKVPQPFRNHNGGAIAFGPDGYLYVGLGDGGSAGDPEGNGQRMDTLLGKMLRLDVSFEPYAIPGDNPFGNEIWALGLRNPWRFAFDRATGDLYIGDVGQGNWEEINFQAAASAGGENYGWVKYEGNHKYGGGSADGLVFPVAEYSHTEGGCSVTGGYVYRGAALPDLQGVYLFGDYCTGLVWSLYHSPTGWQRTLFMDTEAHISSFGEDESGEMYVVDHNGAVYQLTATQ